MQNKILISICLISLFIVSAEVMLAQRYYTVDEGQLLMLSDRGDLRLSTVFPGEGLYTAQIGFSPIKHIGLTGAYVRDRSSREVFRTNGPSTARIIGDYFSLGLGGYYFSKSKKKETRQFYLSEQVMMEEGFLFDLYAGYRYGTLENIYYQNSRSIFDTHKFYLQLGVHWTFRIGTLSYAIRGVYLDFAKGKANGPLDDPVLQDLFDGGIQDNAPFNFYESSFRYQIGIKQVRIYTSVSTRYSDGDKRPINQKRTVITAGLIFELDELFGKKSSVDDLPSEG
jgi:hypothetical protein